MEFTQALIGDRRLADTAFDVILAFDILHILEDFEQAVQRIYGLLKPGGIFLIVTPCMRERMTVLSRVQVAFYILMTGLGLIPVKLNRFTFADMKNTLATSHFVLLDTEVLFFKMSSLFLAVKKPQA